MDNATCVEKCVEGPNFVMQLGILLVFSAVMTIVFAQLKLPSIVAFIAVGIVSKAYGIEPDASIVSAFSSVGIILLLFMAGLEVEVAALVKQLRTVLIIGLGQIFVTCGLGCVLALAVGMDSLVGILYFGLCMTFSSTIAVLGMLKKKRQLESLHGQLCLGLLVLQDITAVLALAVLASLQDTSQSLGMSLLWLFVKLLSMAAVLAILALAPVPCLSYKDTLLSQLFLLMVDDAELLFCGTLGWALAFAAIGGAVDFSPEISAFMAGVALTTLPYKVELEDKVEHIKLIGVLLFFVSLGSSLQLDKAALKILPLSFALALIILTVTMPIIALLGFAAKIKSQPAFMVGGIINQISEFSLILASLCLQAGYFSQENFTAVTIACVLTLFISGLGHEVLHLAFERFGRGWLKCLDARGEKHVDHGGHSGHIVVFGHNELTTQIRALAVRLRADLVLVTLKVSVLKAFADDDAVHTLYADMHDADTWDHVCLQDAMMAISCHDGAQHAEEAIAGWLKRKGAKTAYLASTSKGSDAIELYEAGIHYVIQPDELAAQELDAMFRSRELMALGGAAPQTEGKGKAGNGDGSSCDVVPFRSKDGLAGKMGDEMGGDLTVTAAVSAPPLERVFARPGNGGEDDVEVTKLQDDLPLKPGKGTADVGFARGHGVTRFKTEHNKATSFREYFLRRKVEHIAALEAERAKNPVMFMVG